MITINTERLDTKIEALILEANKVMNFKKERLEILNGAKDLIEKFVNDSACKDLIIDNMYSTGHEIFNGMHNDDNQLKCTCTMQYKKNAPANRDLFARKLDEKFDKIVALHESRLTFNVNEYNVKFDCVKFDIWIKK